LAKKKKKKKEGKSNVLSARKGMTRNVRESRLLIPLTGRIVARSLGIIFLPHVERIAAPLRFFFLDRRVSRAGDFPSSPSPSTGAVNEMAPDYPSRGLEIIKTLLTIRLRAGRHPALVLLDSASRIAAAQIGSWL